MGRPVVHFEIHGKDGGELEKFYTEMFDWKTTTIEEIGYRTVDTASDDSGIGGGLMQSPDGRSLVTVYVDVEDVSADLARAKKLGATVVLDEHDVPGGPTIGMFSDPVGNIVGLVKHSSM